MPAGQQRERRDMTVLRSGDQFAIAAGDQRATIVEVGASRRWRDSLRPPLTQPGRKSVILGS
jgi:hypothetical protein